MQKNLSDDAKISAQLMRAHNETPNLVSLFDKQGFRAFEAALHDGRYMDVGNRQG